MSACKWMADLLLAMFTVYLFFLYFGMFFERRKKDIRVLLGIIVLILWQIGIPEVINELPKAWNIGTTVGLALFVVANVFEGKAWMKGFFAVTFAAIWMLAEMLIGSVLIIYGESIVERQLFGAFASRLLFFLIIQALRKVFTNEKVTGLPTRYSILIIFIPTGSIYIMNAVFVLAYRTDWEYAEGYSLVSGLILLFINVLIFYIYIRLADDLRIRRMNLVYEQQLDLCARHQEERELSVLQMRDVRHGMRNHLLSILAYAERGEREKLIRFVTDIIEDGRLRPSEAINTGNIVTDSLVGYWKKKAEDGGIEFLADLSIPMEMPFRGADISLIMGNLLENAVEGAGTAEHPHLRRMGGYLRQEDHRLRVFSNQRSRAERAVPLLHQGPRAGGVLLGNYRLSFGRGHRHRPSAEERDSAQHTAYARARGVHRQTDGVRQKRQGRAAGPCAALRT